MIPQDIQTRIKNASVIAVLMIDDVKDAVPVARALLAGGIDAMELTLRTDAALDALKAITSEVPEMLAGIGTILTSGQVDEVIDAGAAFGVAPGCNPKVVQHAKDKGLPFAPGIMTPTDIESAIELGCRTLKYFPAESSGGLKHLQYIAAPYLHLGVEFIPLGGLNAQNMATYLESPLIAAIGGSWLAKKPVIKAGDWDAITANAAEARKIADSVKKST